MPSVELPAHNVVLSNFGVTIVGGPEALATRDTDSYVRFDQTNATKDPTILVGDNGDDTSALGFGLYDLPAGARVTEVRFIAEGHVVGTSTPVDTDAFEAALGDIVIDGSGQTNPPVVNTPMLLIRYVGDPFFFGGYNISTFPDNVNGPAECAVVEIAHFLSANVGISADYVFAGIGTPDTGTFGLRPTVYIPRYPNPIVNQSIILTYLAIRITWLAGGGIPPRRIFPRNDGATQGSRRILGGGNTRQAGSRTLGSIL